jgi:hypothetical protein
MGASDEEEIESLAQSFQQNQTFLAGNKFCPNAFYSNETFRMHFVLTKRSKCDLF